MAEEDEIAKGKIENLKGRAKEALGDAAGDESLKAEGIGDRIKGAVREKVGEIKEKASEIKEKKDAAAPDEDEGDQ